VIHPQTAGPTITIKPAARVGNDMTERWAWSVTHWQAPDHVMAQNVVEGLDNAWEAARQALGFKPAAPQSEPRPALSIVEGRRALGIDSRFAGSSFAGAGARDPSQEGRMMTDRQLIEQIRSLVDQWRNGEDDNIVMHAIADLLEQWNRTL
jgi:hypothetical protein